VLAGTIFLLAKQHYFLIFLIIFHATEDPNIIPTVPTSINTSVGASGESLHPFCACIAIGTERNIRIAIRLMRYGMG